MKNPTAMPVYWRLVGFDALGEDFTCAEKEGCIKPYSSDSVNLAFQPARPVILQKKFVKLEASPVRNVVADRVSSSSAVSLKDRPHMPAKIGR